MKFRKKLLLLSLASTLSFNSCSSMESIKEFFEDPMKSSLVAVGVTAPLFSFVFFKIGSFFSVRNISKNYEEQKKINEKTLKQNNDLADQNQKQQSYISDLHNQIENLSNKIKSSEERSNFYKNNLSNVLDKVQNFSNEILESRNKIKETNEGVVR